MKSAGINTLSIICGLLLCTPSFATVHHKVYKGYKDIPVPSRKHVVMSVGGGEAFANQVGDSNTFPPAIIPGNSYEYDFGSDQSPFFNAFVGGQWPLTSNLDVQAGLAYYYIGSFSADGTVNQGVDPQSSNVYDVDYQIRSQSLLFDTKWLYAPGRYHPYLSAGVGCAFNNASDFDVTIVPPFTTVSREFNDHDTTSFTYTVGLGVDVDVYERVRIGVGYRFSDLGKVSLGDSNIFGIAQAGTLSQSHFYTNNVIAQLILLV